MKINAVSDSFAVSPQIDPGDLESAASQGFETVICNRPDDEEAGQPDARAMRVAAETLGLSFHHTPVCGGEFPPGAVAEFLRVREQAEGKVLAYCRTGTRSITLDALANVEKLSGEERIARAKAAGYDITAMRARFAD